MSGEPEHQQVVDQLLLRQPRALVVLTVDHRADEAVTITAGPRAGDDLEHLGLEPAPTPTRAPGRRAWKVELDVDRAVQELRVPARPLGQVLDPDAHDPEDHVEGDDLGLLHDRQLIAAAPGLHPTLEGLGDDVPDTRAGQAGGRERRPARPPHAPVIHPIYREHRTPQERELDQVRGIRVLVLEHREALVGHDDERVVAEAQVDPQNAGPSWARASRSRPTASVANLGRLPTIGQPPASLGASLAGLDIVRWPAYTEMPRPSWLRHFRKKKSPEGSGPRGTVRSRASNYLPTYELPN